MQKNNNTYEIKMQVSHDYVPHDNARIEISEQGDEIIEATYIKTRYEQGTIKKLDKERYVVLSTGEIRECVHKDKKDIHELVRTFSKLKALIRTNFSKKGDNQLFITLTYEQNMTDPKRLYTDFNKFMKRLKYKYSEHQFEYITVAEPQKRGAWHIHMMLKSNKEILYIDNKIMEELWQQGYTDTQKLRSDDVGQYYIAYFTGLVTDSKGEQIKDSEVTNSKSKKIEKGSRLSYYPVNFKFYRTSRGIKQPTVSVAEWKDVVKMCKKPVYQTTIEIIKIDLETQETKQVNLIHKATFRKSGKRKRLEKKEKD